MSLLTLIQTTCDSIGLTRPSVVITSADQNVRTLLALANTSGEELMKRYEWQELTKEVTFTSTGTISQGSLASIASDMDRFVNDTFWNRGLREKIQGPVTQQQWQQDLSFNVVGPPYKFIVNDGTLYVGPTPLAAGQTLAFNYITQNWCQSSVGTGQAVWTADTDTTKIPERIHRLDLIWRFKSAKGLSYAEDLETAERSIEKHFGTNTARRILFVGGSDVRFFAENIPNGDWPTA
jgi:hypothetical protein